MANDLARYVPADGYVEMEEDPEGAFVRHEDAEAEIKRLQQWVDDLMSGMQVNCVYCGHRYGPATDIPVAMADILKEHIEQCPAHPMSKLKNEMILKQAEVEALGSELLASQQDCVQAKRLLRRAFRAVRRLMSARFDAKLAYDEEAQEYTRLMEETREFAGKEEPDATCQHR